MWESRTMTARADDWLQNRRGAHRTAAEWFYSTRGNFGAVGGHSWLSAGAGDVGWQQRPGTDGRTDGWTGRAGRGEAWTEARFNEAGGADEQQREERFTCRRGSIEMATAGQRHRLAGRGARLAGCLSSSPHALLCPSRSARAHASVRHVLGA